MRKKAAAAVGSLAVAVMAVAPPAPSVSAQESVVALTQVATANAPTGGAAGPDGTIWIVERAGPVRLLEAGGLSAPVLDYTGETTTDGERGMAGIAFDPGFEHVYVSYTDIDGHNRVDEYAVAGGLPQPETRRNVFFSEQPESAHNSGHIAFGPDGMFYISVGDGGFSFEGDPFNNAQDLGTLLGSVLRLDLGSGDPYGIPPDNPFVGDPNARGEIWAYGLRNPWQFSFDALTGDFWLGDVGNLEREEVDFLPAGTGGANFGWPIMEGNLPNRDQPPPSDYVPPVLDYAHANNRCSVTGGYVYRGAAIPALQGSYLFSDWCEGAIRSLTPGGQEVNLVGGAGMAVSFVQDANLELYVLDVGAFTGGGGAIYRLDPTQQPTSSPTAPPTSSPTGPPPAGGCHVVYRAADWGGSPGFTANVEVANTGGGTIDGWSVVWDFPAGQVVNEHWGASITQGGATVAASNASWNGTIAPNQTVNFGFNGAAATVGNNQPPTAFTLNGASCTVG